jgi:hypothetical protein
LIETPFSTMVVNTLAISPSINIVGKPKKSP